MDVARNIARNVAPCIRAFTVHGCGALYCELDVRVDCIKMAMEIVKLCRLYTRV